MQIKDLSVDELKHLIRETVAEAIARHWRDREQVQPPQTDATLLATLATLDPCEDEFPNPDAGLQQLDDITL